MKSQDKSATTHIRNLARIICKLDSHQEVERFLLDLTTPAELRALADRWRVALMVEKEVPYREIAEKTGVSTATVTRVARCVSEGAGGYRAALDKK